ncbi:MAG: hypothetical protein J6K17_10570 [Oscillospiraceae bacterium]|nr:hypothetical protein [Oscillospiraceae bacterium]
MSKSKKIILIVVGAILFLFLAFVGFVLWELFEVDKQIEEAWYSRIAKNDAAEYYEEKYGEKLVVTDMDVIYSGGFMFDSGIFTGYVLMYAENCRVLWYNGECWDNKQNDEICQAITEKYFYDETLGAIREITVNVEYNDYFKDFVYGGLQNYAKGYFDGDLERFIAENSPYLECYVYYDGYPEKAEKYREIIENKLNEITTDFTYAEAAIYVFDPTLDLPEMKYKCMIDRVDHLEVPTGERYMEMITGGKTRTEYGLSMKDKEKQEYALYETNWNMIDEYTAICDVLSDKPLDKSDYTFIQTDIHKNETALRGRYSGVESTNPIVITNPVYKVGLASDNDVFLRLDREYYEITENTAPLLVFEQGQEKVLKYVTCGWGKGDYNDIDDHNSWFYLDEEYLYLYIDSTTLYILDPRLTFVNISEIVLDK